MACDSKAEVLRIALNFLQLNEHHERRQQERRENIARRFTQRLVRTYGADEEVEIYLRADGSVAYTVGDLVPSGMRVEARRGDDDLIHFDLVDTSNEGEPEQIGIRHFAVAAPDEVEDGESITRRLGEIHEAIGGIDGPVVERVTAEGITLI